MIGQQTFNIPESLTLKTFNIRILLLQLVGELKLNFLFIKRDIPALIIPGFLFTITALINHPPALAIEGLWSIGRNFIYIWLCLTCFCISNQINGIDEDRLNKPDRPLVKGIVSYQGAQIRWYIVMVLLLFLAWYLGTLGWTIVWQIAVIAHNQFNLSKYWALKNLMSAYGVIYVIAVSWQMVGVISPEVWRWLAVLGGTFMSLISIQDLRDMEGDRAIGRRTFPLIFGEMPSRILLSFGFGILPVFTHSFLMAPMGNNLMIIFWDLILAITSLIIAGRVFFCRSQVADHQTYMLFTYWYCLTLLSSIFILRV